jgi:hypothetical protein
MTGTDIRKLVCAAMLGAAVAFPAGMLLSGAGEGGERQARIAKSAPAAAGRAAYSPELLSDHWFLDQQRKGAEALEAHCRATGAMCTEAQAIRRWLEEHGG